MSAALERRYRAALDWYPSAWRAENGEAMLGTLLDEAEATGREKPRLGDLANLAMHGLAASASQLPNRIPPAIRDRVAAISLGTGFALSLVVFLGAEWAPWAPNGPWNGWAFDWRVVNSEVPGFGPFASAGVVLFALWFAAFGFALVGLARTASFTLFATFPVSLLLVENAGHRMASLRPTDGLLVVLAALALLADRNARALDGWPSPLVSQSCCRLRSEPSRLPAARVRRGGASRRASTRGTASSRSLARCFSSPLWPFSWSLRWRERAEIGRSPWESRRCRGGFRCS